MVMEKFRFAERGSKGRDDLRHQIAGKVVVFQRDAVLAGLAPARELIDHVIVSPPEHGGDPSGIKLIGDFVAMLKAAGMERTGAKNQALSTDVLGLFVSSVKVGSGGKAPWSSFPESHHPRDLV